MVNLQDDLELDKVLAFAILMESDDGIKGKRPDYIMEKWRGLHQCRDRMEVKMFLDPFKVGIFDACRLKWFGEYPHYPFGPVVILPSDTFCFPTTNEGEKQEVAPTLRYIKCEKHSGANAESARSEFCYVQDDGTHRKGDICICGTEPLEECPLDLHRRHAVGLPPMEDGSLFA